MWRHRAVQNHNFLVLLLLVSYFLCGLDTKKSSKFSRNVVKLPNCLQLFLQMWPFLRTKAEKDNFAIFLHGFSHKMLFFLLLFIFLWEVAKIFSPEHKKERFFVSKNTFTIRALCPLLKERGERLDLERHFAIFVQGGNKKE